MIKGIGTDILKIDELSSLYLTIEDPFVIATYSINEIREALASRSSHDYFALRFAGKEAVFKCLATGEERIYLRDIQILTDANNQPYVELTGTVKEIAKRKGISNVEISLSYNFEYATAFAIAQ